MMVDDPSPATALLDRMLGFLDHDPDNVALLADTADAALDAYRPDIAIALLERRAAILPPSQRERNLAGLAAMQEKRFADAAALFDGLMADGEDAPALRFNYAWSAAMEKDFAQALAALDDATVDALGQAAMLKVQLLHDAGRLEDAATIGRGGLDRHPDHPGLAAAMSVLALDMEDVELAATCAAKGGRYPDALTTRGTLTLADDDAAGARALFDEALAVNRHVPRAWIGRGLSKMLTGDTDGASIDIDRGATMFGNHIGSWIAAGWAYLMVQDRPRARERFETALAIDPAFAECQGSLAVVAILDGNVVEGRERATVAFRLDRQCFSGALARMLLATHDGDTARARKIFETAMTAPIDDSGRTIARSLVRLGLT